MNRKYASREFPDLREAYLRFIQTTDPQLERYAFVNVEADRMTNSLNTLREQIFAWQRNPTAQSGKEANN